MPYTYVYMAYSYGPTIVKDGLVLALDAANPKSYAGSGTVWSDLTGNGRAGSLVNGPTFNAANGGGIVFDGSNDFGYVSSTFPSYTNFTVSFWIKINTTALHRGIFCIKNSADNADYTNGNYAIHTLTGGYFGFEANELFAGNTSKNNTVINNIISHCTVVCNQTNLLTTYYLNGVADGTQAMTATVTFSDHNLLFLGCRQYNTTGLVNVQNQLTGTVYSYNFYNRALSASEVLQNYTATKGRFGLA